MHANYRDMVSGWLFAASNVDLGAVYYKISILIEVIMEIYLNKNTYAK